MLKRVDVAFRRLFDELAIKDLPAIVLMREPLRTNLQAMREQAGNDDGKATHGVPAKAASAGTIKEATETPDHFWPRRTPGPA